VTKRFVLCALWLGFLGCSHEQGSPPAMESAVAGPGADHGPRARVITLDLTMQADDLPALDRALRALVEHEDGYVQTATVEEGSATSTLRVPSDRLTAFRRSVRRLAEVTRESETVEDVGDQRADLDARLRNARREEERLLALLNDRTAVLSDVIAVEEHLARVRERIEQLDAQHTALEQRIEYAVVHVYAVKTPVAFWMEPGQTLASAARFGVDAVCAIAVGIAAATVAVGPTLLAFVLLLAMLVMGARTLLRRRAAT
jgi:hypothetical protein